MKEKTMKFDVKNGLKLIAVALSSIVGVGFVSGAEIWQFFAKFGDFVFMQIPIFFLLIFFFTNKILKNNDREKILVKMQKNDKISSKKAILIKNKLKKILSFLSLLLISGAMLSGLKVLTKRLFLSNYFWVYLICVFVVFAVVYFGFSGLKKFDSITFVFITALTIFFVWILIFEKGKNVTMKSLEIEVNGNVILSIFSVLAYFFMNFLQVVPVLEKNEQPFSRKERLTFSAIFSAIISVILFVFVMFLKQNTKYYSADMPFLDYFFLRGGVIEILFVVILFFALISSLLSSIFGVKELLFQRLDSKILACFFAVLIANILSFIPFKFFVSVVYPALGVINFVILIFL